MQEKGGGSMTAETDQPELRALVTARFQQSMSIPETFFAAEEERIAHACWEMARRFHQGGRLLAFGNGASATDAQHVSVEFVHPVIVGKRALPALALTNDAATISRGPIYRARVSPDHARDVSDNTQDTPFVHQIKVLARPQDIAMGFTLDGNCPNVIAALETARHIGLLTLGMGGGDGGLLKNSKIDFPFIVHSNDPMAIQETHETLYHVLWELVHIFFEHEGLLT
jgi:D-sedoheptulose 7-phosphate isomerase